MTSNLRVEPCSDHTYIESVFEHPAVRPYVTHDALPKDIDLRPLLACSDVVFLKAYLNDAPCGGFLFKGNDAHTVLLPPARGNLAVELAKLAVEWVHQNRGYDHLVSYCYSCHPHTLWFAKRIGFVHAGTRDDHITVKGEPVLTYSLLYRF